MAVIVIGRSVVGGGRGEWIVVVGGEHDVVAGVHWVVQGSDIVCLRFQSRPCSIY